MSRKRRGREYYRHRRRAQQIRELEETRAKAEQEEKERKRQIRRNRLASRKAFCLPEYWYYNFHDIYILKLAPRVYLPFCLRCLRFGHTQLKSYKPKEFQRLKKPCRPRYKSQAKDKHHREKLVYLLNWYADFQKNSVLCANPDCSNVIHPNYILQKIRTLKHSKIFYNLLSNGIELIFLCCNCHQTKKYDLLSVVRTKNPPLKTNAWANP